MSGNHEKERVLMNRDGHQSWEASGALASDISQCVQKWVAAQRAAGLDEPGIFVALVGAFGTNLTGFNLSLAETAQEFGARTSDTRELFLELFDCQAADMLERFNEVKGPVRAAQEKAAVH